MKKLDVKNIIKYVAMSGYLLTSGCLCDAMTWNDRENVDASTINVDDVDHEGQTPLHAAVRQNDLRAVAILLERGAAVDAVDRNGLTPLHIAAEQGNLEIAELLLEHGANVDAMDPANQTPLFKVLLRSNLWAYIELTELLLRHGADVKVKDRYGRTLLHATVGDAKAAEDDNNYNLVAIVWLVNRGADVDAIDLNGQRAEELARANKKFVCARYLRIARLKRMSLFRQLFHCFTFDIFL
ncbi:MAG: ankyrin repeat domain-containing protein [Puniceicoccales bacterium]|jgi:ankyrin repeat protein|nr:ankyrin repeat domain-containing protein [Puniceicoccales bacterium]